MFYAGTEPSFCKLNLCGIPMYETERMFWLRLGVCWAVSALLFGASPFPEALQRPRGTGLTQQGRRHPGLNS